MVVSKKVVPNAKIAIGREQKNKLRNSYTLFSYIWSGKCDSQIKRIEISQWEINIISKIMTSQKVYQTENKEMICVANFLWCRNLDIITNT